MVRSFILPVLFGLIMAIAGPAFSVAETMQATMYDDGFACPGGCDPHVVFAKQHNGSENAFLPPLSNRKNPSAHPCLRGRTCMICFDASEASCMEVVYRGNGPHKGRFDFSAAFMREVCTKASGLPAALQRHCQGMERTAAKIYGGKLSCIAQPGEPTCKARMAEALALQAADRPEFEACLQVGVAAYNKTQDDPQFHRSRRNGCAYAENLRETNNKGQSWQRLMPGACRDGTFVGRHGLDCCTGEPLVDASFGQGECALYIGKRV